MYKQKYKEGQQIHKDIYLYICRYIKEHRYAPSYKEIADDVGVSNATVLRHMDMLRTDGLIETDHPKTPRAFRVARGVLVNDLWDVSPAYDRTLNRNDDNSLLKQFEAVAGQIRRCVKREQ